MVLVIGNKRLSSWSLRPWLVLKQFDIPFEERLISLDQADTHAAILKYSPSGKVPALVDGSTVIWESLAIAEYLNDKFPDRKMWPSDLRLRGRARAVAHEMHGGFQALRENLPMDMQKQLTGGGFESSPTAAMAAVAEDIARILALWTACLEARSGGGPFLFGEFTIADAMYAPVVSRFLSYGVPVSGLARDYMAVVWALPAVRGWVEDARAESFVVES